MKENSPIWARLAATVSAVELECRKARTISQAAADLPTTMMATVASTASGASTNTIGFEQHADGDEEQHGEGVAQRHRLLGGALAEVAFAHHHAGEEGAERERDAEHLGRAEGDAERDGVDGEAEQLARAGAGGVVHQPRDHAAADDQHDRHEHRHLGQR